MKRIPRRLFTEEFKREAIKLVTEQHFNAARAGRQLDIDPKSIRLWIAQSERGELAGSLGAAKLTADHRRFAFSCMPRLWTHYSNSFQSNSGIVKFSYAVVS